MNSNAQNKQVRWCQSTIDCWSGTVELESIMKKKTVADAKRQKFKACILIGLAMGQGLTIQKTLADRPAESRPQMARRPASNHVRLPLAFEVSGAETDDQADFIVRGQGYTLLLTSTGATMRLRSEDRMSQQAGGGGLQMRLIGSNPKARAVALERLPGTVNYFLGNDPAKWRTGVPLFGRVKYGQVYAGVDLVYYGNEQRLEYDFVVAPNADPGVIRLQFDGADSLDLDENGDLLVRLPTGAVRLRRPFAYQEVDGQRREIATGYKPPPSTAENAESRINDLCVGFCIAEYDTSRPLVIDPVLEYSTLFGGGGNELNVSVAVDADGFVYLAGDTGDDLDFPFTPGAAPSNYGGNGDIFIAKLGPEGTNLVYATLLGGSDYELSRGLAVDDEGNAYVTGTTVSTDFPTTPGAFQTTFIGYEDAFVTKLGPQGTNLVFSTYLGASSGSSECRDIVVDAEKRPIVTGQTTSGFFSRTPGAFASANKGIFVTKFNTEGTDLVYSAMIGGGAVFGLALDTQGNAYVAGQSRSSLNYPITPGALKTNAPSPDAFVTKLHFSGSNLVYSTFLGGDSFVNPQDSAQAIAVDGTGCAYVVGYTTEDDFPTTPGAADTQQDGAADVFISKLGPEGANLIYSTFLGGPDDASGARPDKGLDIVVNALGEAWVIGETTAKQFPRTQDAFDHNFGGSVEAFLTKVGKEGTNFVFSTLIGGSSSETGTGVAIDRLGNVYAAGFTGSPDFSTTPGAYQANQKTNSLGFPSTEAFLLKVFDPVPVALEIGDISIVGADVHINFMTALGNTYRVEYRNSLSPGDWMVLTNNIPGTGEIVGVTDAGALADESSRYYQLILVSPSP